MFSYGEKNACPQLHRLAESGGTVSRPPARGLPWGYTTGWCRWLVPRYDTEKSSKLRRLRLSKNWVIFAIMKKKQLSHSKAIWLIYQCFLAIQYSKTRPFTCHFPFLRWLTVGKTRSQTACRAKTSHWHISSCCHLGWPATQPGHRRSHCNWCRMWIIYANLWILKTTHICTNMYKYSNIHIHIH